MRKIFLILVAFIFTGTAFAQAPEKISYQAVVRDQNGALKTNTTIGVQVSITKDGGMFPQLVYTETHTATSNTNGLITLEIGNGTVVNGNFSTIDWGNGSYTLNTNYDLSGGTNYGLLGSSKLLSVPYALYAKTAGNATGGADLPTATTIGQMMYWNGTSWTLISPSTDGTVLTVENGIPVWKEQQPSITTPTLNTNTVSNITNNQAYFSGYVTSDGGGAVAERGFCYGTSQNPTVQNSIVACGNGLGSFNATVPGLNENTDYNVRAYATNSAGTVYGNQQSFTTAALSIGHSYQGGIVAYILQPGDPGYDANVRHGLIAAPSDQSTGAEWGCYGNEISGADGTALGTGKQNTIDIVAGCTTTGTAADICANLVLNGYSDWYLPSLDELKKIFINIGTVGGFSSNSYWSSTERDETSAYFFSTSGSGYASKRNTNNVRAVRSF